MAGSTTRRSVLTSRMKHYILHSVFLFHCSLSSLGSVQDASIAADSSRPHQGQFRVGYCTWPKEGLSPWALRYTPFFHRAWEAVTCPVLRYRPLTKTNSEVFESL